MKDWWWNNCTTLKCNFFETQARSRLPPASPRRWGSPCCSAVTSASRRTTPCGRCAGLTGTASSCWRTSRGALRTSAIRTPTCSSPPRVATAAPSASRGCGPRTRDVTAVSSTSSRQGGKRGRRASVLPVSLVLKNTLNYIYCHLVMSFRKINQFSLYICGHFGLFSLYFYKNFTCWHPTFELLLLFFFHKDWACLLFIKGLPNRK